jgi:hypothetical protein
MNWFSVLAAIAIVCTAYFGVDHPARTILLQAGIALVAFIGLGIEWWNESKGKSQAMRARTRATDGAGTQMPAPALGQERRVSAGWRSAAPTVAAAARRP